jgi:hypothetical protein
MHFLAVKSGIGQTPTFANAPKGWQLSKDHEDW